MGQNEPGKNMGEKDDTRSKFAIKAFVVTPLKTCSAIQRDKQFIPPGYTSPSKQGLWRSEAKTEQWEKVLSYHTKRTLHTPNPRTCSHYTFSPLGNYVRVLNWTDARRHLDPRVIQEV